MNLPLPSKPALRGWLHLIAAPLAAIAGTILLVMSPPDLRIPIGIYVLSTITLFTISATYHRVNWSPRVRPWMQKVDHSAIFVLIAGSYTAITCSIIGGTFSTVVSLLAWGAAIVGILLRLLWQSAPRWLFVPCYVIFGVAGAAFAPAVLQSGGGLTLTLVIIGGVFYIIGAVIFASQLPNPSPNWFGFHEVFHSFTLGGYATHFAAIAVGALTVGGTTLH